MKRLILGFLMILLFLTGCNNNVGSSSTNNNSPVAIGSLPNGSTIYLSLNNIPITAGSSNTTNIFISDGTDNQTFSISYALGSDEIKGSTLTNKKTNALHDTNDVINPDPCILGTPGSGAPSSCPTTISVPADAYAGTYKITPTATSADGTSTQLSPITVLVSGSVAPSSKAITSFSLNNTAGVITGTNIAVTVPFGTDVSSLVATYS